MRNTLVACNSHRAREEMGKSRDDVSRAPSAAEVTSVQYSALDNSAPLHRSSTRISATESLENFLSCVKNHSSASISKDGSNSTHKCMV